MRNRLRWLPLILAAVLLCTPAGAQVYSRIFNSLIVDGDLTVGGRRANKVTVTSTVAAGTPSISATGSDSNINLSLLPKGTGTVIAQANVVSQNVIGGLDFVHRVDVPDGATGTIDTTLTHKTRVIDAWLVKTGGAGGAGDTITVNNGATAITNAMSINVADQTVVRAGTVDDAAWDIAAAGTLRIVRTKASAASVACTVFVKGIRVP